MNRQMAFQLNTREFFERVVKLLRGRSKETEGLGLNAWIEKLTPDENERQKLRAVFTVMYQCDQKKRDVFTVTKLIAWRNDKGEPTQIETLFGKTQIDLKKAGLIKEESL